MRFIIYTERGIFASNETPFKQEDYDAGLELMKKAARGDLKFLSFSTETGQVILPEEVLKTAVITIEKD